MRSSRYGIIRCFRADLEVLERFGTEVIVSVILSLQFVQRFFEIVFLHAAVVRYRSPSLGEMITV